jgi:hypothetical protein
MGSGTTSTSRRTCRCSGSSATRWDSRARSLGAFVAISKSEIQRERVLVRTELADGLPLVRGDRIQLQDSCSARDAIVASFDEFSGRYYRDDATVAIVGRR